MPFGTHQTLMSIGLEILETKRTRKYLGGFLEEGKILLSFTKSGSGRSTEEKVMVRGSLSSLKNLSGVEVMTQFCTIRTILLP